MLFDWPSIRYTLRFQELVINSNNLFYKQYTVCVQELIALSAKFSINNAFVVVPPC